jgi:hypothetical protein
LVVRAELIACCAGDQFLKTIAIGALSLLVATAAFLVSIPVSAMEFHSLDPFFPSVDVISVCSFWQVLLRLFSRGRVCFSSPGDDER